LGSNAVVLNLAYEHNSGFYFEPDNVARQSAFQLFNASATWKTADDHYSVMLYGNNLADKPVYSAIITIPSGPQIATLSAPRTYGIKLAYQY
jgi:iron complex outermembrane receptor protein